MPSPRPFLSPIETLPEADNQSKGNAELESSDDEERPIPIYDLVGDQSRGIAWAT
jgi:hypothetical protein